MSEILQHIEYGDLIRFEHWRLQNIEITHTNGIDPKTGNPLIQNKGWNTYIDKITGEEIKVPETIDSSKTPFESTILLVPPHLLGTHESTDPEHPEQIPNGFESKGFSTVHFESGIWDGPAIAVAAFCVCKEDTIIKDNIYKSIIKKLSAKGKPGLLEEIEYGDLLILDGHHRTAKAVHEGFAFVPVQVIPYLHHDSVLLDTWHNDGNVWNGEQVFNCAKNPGMYADAKRTKFGVEGNDGIKRRILDALPTLTIPLENLKPR